MLFRSVYFVRNDRTFRCGAEGCGKSFYVLQRLQVHMRTHNGDKPFICKEKNCGKKFTTAGNLKNHKRTHTGWLEVLLLIGSYDMVRYYRCERCVCGLLVSLSLFVYALLGEKPFLCEADGCGRSFAENSSLRKHMLVHSGESRRCQN